MHATGSKGPMCDVKGVRKTIGVTPLVGLMDPYTSKERGFFEYWRIRG